MKKLVMVFVAAMLATASYQQTVFTYGKYAVTKDEFVRAFNKNPSAGADRKKALKEYLNLYVNFKLKVRAAYDAGLDKDPTQQFELQNFKKQLADNIINDEADIKALVKEAFERSHKEIQLQQVFVEIPQNGDTVAAYKNIQSAYQQLKQGKNFGAVAQEFSTDPAVRQSKGEVGFITVFTLPYQMENEVYALKPQSFSVPFKSKAGYHIFKNEGEQQASGSRRIAQILVALPTNASAEEHKATAQKADSLYHLVTSGSDFATVASSASNDLSSANNRGELPEFTKGTYNPGFENVVFSLKKGEVSKPFETEFGFHIVKLIEVKPAPTDLNDPATFAALQDKVVKDKRIDFSKKELIQKKLALIKFRPLTGKPDDLYAFTDSALSGSKQVSVKGINENTPVFSFARQTMKVADWLKFVKSATTANTYLSNKERDKELYKEFVGAAADEYYRNHLDAYNQGYSRQVEEFKEANLLFGVMEKNVWGKANTDTAGLLQYYNQHKSKYIWKASADVILVTCSNEKQVNESQKKLKDDFSGWRQLTIDNGTDVTADSGRYELAQLPVIERTNFTAGLITAPVKNPNDGTYTFGYVIKVYNSPDERTFEDARGMVISDYQQVLEDRWIAELKKKYPVKINDAVFQSIR